MSAFVAIFKIRFILGLQYRMAAFAGIISSWCLVLFMNLAVQI